MRQGDDPALDPLGLSFLGLQGFGFSLVGSVGRRLRAMIQHRAPAPPGASDYNSGIVTSTVEPGGRLEPGSGDEPTLQEVGRALAGDEEALSVAGDEEALSGLVEALTPVIQARVARGLLLWRTGLAAGRNIRQEVEDLFQEIFLVLFGADGKMLRSWRPERGLTLKNFVGLVAERQTASVLRSGKRSPWKEDPTLAEDLDREADREGPEDRAATRQELRRMLRRLTEELSPLGRQLFDLLFVRELTVQEVVQENGLSADAVYQWHSRIRRLANRLRREASEDGARRRTA